MFDWFSWYVFDTSLYNAILLTGTCISVLSRLVYYALCAILTDRRVYFMCHVITLPPLSTTHDSKVYGANMRPIWGRQDPGGFHVGPMNLVIWDGTLSCNCFWMLRKSNFSLCPFMINGQENSNDNDQSTSLYMGTITRNKFCLP